MCAAFPLRFRYTYLYEIDRCAAESCQPLSSSSLSSGYRRTALAQEGALDPAPPKGVTTDEIIRHFAAKEKEFQGARDQYTYRQDVRVITPDDNGEYHEIFDVLFDDQGKTPGERGFCAAVFVEPDLDVARRH